MKTIFKVFIFIFLISCSNKGTDKFKYFDCINYENEDCMESEKTLKSLNKEELMAYETAVNFYLWYCSVRSELNQDGLVIYDDSLKYYTISHSHLDYYLNKFTKSEIVSESFIIKLKNVIDEYESYLESEKFSSGEEMVGFEGDIILNSQDPYCDINKEGFEVSSISVFKNKIEISFLIPGIVVELVKGSDKKWEISSII